MTFKLLGITDENTTCDCCGKSNLKCTVALDHDGDVVFYGRDCAGRALYSRASSATAVKHLERKARAFERVRGSLPDVMECINEGLNWKQAQMKLSKKYGHNFRVTYGHYCDTGNKMPLEISCEYQEPVIKLAPEAY